MTITRSSAGPGPAVTVTCHCGWLSWAACTGPSPSGVLGGLTQVRAIQLNAGGRISSSRIRTTAASATGLSGPPSRRTLFTSATQESVAGPMAALSSGVSWTFSGTQISSR
jgi:hypothetical protein